MPTVFYLGANFNSCDEINISLQNNIAVIDKLILLKTAIGFKNLWFILLILNGIKLVYIPANRK